MIVRMQHVTLLCMARDAEKTLRSLRELGAVHMDLSGAAGEPFAAAKQDYEQAEAAVRILAKAAKDCSEPAKEFREMSVAEVLAEDARRDELKASADELRRVIRVYAPYGDFDPALAKKLLDAGIDLSRVATLPDKLPPERLSVLQNRLAETEAKIAAITASFATANREASRITAKFPDLKDRIAFRAAEEALASAGAVSYLVGWVPVTEVPALRAKAVTNAWGLALRDPNPDETPPTLIRPPKLFRPVAALFQGLGIAPAYCEADVSVPFMCYFSLFFAMLVGDGAYGAIFLALTLWGWKKTKPKEGAGHRPKAVRSWLALMTVFSTATVIWGALSNTWFGAGFPFAKDWATVRWLADPSYNNMMLLCFTIGVSHLMLARIWNGISKINDLGCLAEFGWAGVLLTMYLVTNSIVGIFPAFPAWAYWVGGVSVALVFGFTVKPCELKTRGIELGMLPLNIMSALGDIISYVRLFAVGLASVKVAENFNGMALGFVQGEHAWWVTAIASVATAGVLLIGHGLNLTMAGLSILVHAVRLNTLEFSNHKGVSWAGCAFNPFRKTK